MTDTPLKVYAYMNAIPPGNKNPEKPKLLEYFVEGVTKTGDKGMIVTSNTYEPSDVAVLQGFVHPQSKHVPHLNLRRNVLDGQASIGKRTIIADSNLFLAYDPGNTKTYLRYSYDGIFPNTGEYCDSKIYPQRWANLRDDLNLSIKPYKKYGDYILVTCQRDMGWSMDGLAVINWLHVLLQDLRRFTDRKVLVRFHPGDKKLPKHVQQLRAIGHKVEISSPTSTLLKDLHDAYAVISYNSSPAVVAAIEGVPIFVLDPLRSQSAEVANRNLKEIENPSYDFDRETWLRRLAMMHWRLDELRSGECWQHMRNWVHK
ncbi:MAG: hypothetical protein CMD92_08765 [Gammaproteobacteria bacterium]|jgi:hypothetical protein|nr:hypothetical protein [Gammaproteobacteria bacterium]|tara:strand:- start:906 stop:1850 length:945 start_codon:yes stop_codon:yes gene_type:complete